MLRSIVPASAARYVTGSVNPSRVRLSGLERATLGEIGRRVGCKALREVACLPVLRRKPDIGLRTKPVRFWAVDRKSRLLPDFWYHRRLGLSSYRGE
jgi:hypothetical protein